MCFVREAYVRDTVSESSGVMGITVSDRRRLQGADVRCVEACWCDGAFFDGEGLWSK